MRLRLANYRAMLFAIGGALRCCWARRLAARSAQCASQRGRAGGYGPRGAGGDAAASLLQTCALCHGGDARGTDRGADAGKSDALRTMPDSGIADIIQKGRGRCRRFRCRGRDRYAGAVSPVANMPAAAAEPVAGASPAPRGREAVLWRAQGVPSCHAVRGRGSVDGPDLSDIGKRLRLPELEMALARSERAHCAGLRDRDGDDEGRKRTLRGFARAQGSHDLVLQTARWQAASRCWTASTGHAARTPESAMPAFHGTADEQRDLLAYLSTLQGSCAWGR